MRPEARPASRRSDDAARIHDLGEDAGGDCPGKHRPRGGDHQGADGHLLPPDDPGEPGKVLVAAVRAGSDEDLVEVRPRDLLRLPDGIHPVRNRDEGHDLVEIDPDRPFIAAVLRHLGRCRDPVVREVADGDRIGVEDPRLRPRLDRHVREGQPPVHRDRRRPVAHELQRPVGRPLHPEFRDVGEGEVFRLRSTGELSGKVERNRLRDAEPRLPRGPDRRHIGRSHPGGERAEGAEGAGVGVGADDDRAGPDDPFTHHLVADPAAGIRERDPRYPGVLTKLGLERRRRPGVRRDDVVEDEPEAVGVREPLHPHLPERFPGEDAGSVVGEGDIDLAVDIRSRRCPEDRFGERAHWTIPSFAARRRLQSTSRVTLHFPSLFCFTCSSTHRASSSERSNP